VPPNFSWPSWWLGFASFPVLAAIVVIAAILIEDWRLTRRHLRLPCGEPADPRYAAYDSHRWTGKRQCIPGEPDEWFRYCDACGCEDLGDPREFPDLNYPRCDAAGYLAGGAPGPDPYAPDPRLQYAAAGAVPQITDLDLQRAGITDRERAGMIQQGDRLSIQFTGGAPAGAFVTGLGPGEWRRKHFDNVARLDRAQVLGAVAFLRGWMGDSLEFIRNSGRDNDEWWTAHHFAGMMGVRNALRSSGHGETELGVDNLDDYAVGLVELACGLTELCNSNNGEGIYCERPAGHPERHTAIRGDFITGVLRCWLPTPAERAIASNVGEKCAVHYNEPPQPAEPPTLPPARSNDTAGDTTERAA